MRSKRLTAPFAALLCAGLFLAGGEAFADLQTQETVPPPPAVVPLSVAVERGSEAVIRLRTVGTPPRGTRFLIRKGPRNGELRVLKRGDARVVYRHNGGEGGLDEFTYAAQAPGTGVSAAARVRVLVVDPPPALSAPLLVDFGEFAAGESPSRELVIQNAGAGRLAGRVSAPPEITVTGGEVFDLGPAEVKILGLRLSRPKAGHYSATVGIETQLGRHPVPVVAEPFAPFDVSPAELRIAYANGARKGGLRLKSNLPAAGFVEAQGGGAWGLPEMIEIAPGAELELALSPAGDNPGPASGEITFRRGAFERTVRVSAEAVPPLLAVEPDTVLDLGSIDAGVPAGFSFSVSNRGGEEGFVKIVRHAELDIPLAREPFPLAPGGKARVTGSITARRSGPLTRDIIVSMGGQSRRLAVRADARLPKAAAEPARPPAYFLPPEPPPSPVPAYDSGSETAPSWPEALSGPRAAAPRLIERKGRRAVVEWDHFPGADAYNLEQLFLSIREGGLHMEWVPLRTAKITTSGPAARAELADLPDYGWVMLRVRAFKGGEPAAEPSEDLRFLIPRPAFPWGWAAGLAALAGGGVWLLIRRRLAQEADAEGGQFSPA